jgi:RHS repeat-associated protein
VRCNIFAYDADPLIGETKASGAVVARYSRSQNVGTTSFDIVEDVDSFNFPSGADLLANTHTFDSFGETGARGLLTNPFKYSEQELNPGLYYYRARYSDASTGRFISEDPIGFRGGTDFYAYVANDPVDWIDPLGLLAEVICEPIPSMRGGWKYAIPMKISRAHHCFIHVKCDGYDVTLELYGPSAQDPKHGSPHMNAYNPNRGDIHVPIQVPSGYGCCTFENNLLKNFQKEGGNIPTYSGYPGPNSNTFVYTIVTESGGGVNMPSTAYGWDYLPPAPPPVSLPHH